MSDEEYVGIDRRQHKDIATMEKDIKSLLENLEKVFNLKFDILSNKIDEIKDNQSKEINSIKDDIRSLKDKQSCIDIEMISLKNKPAVEKASTFDSVLKKIWELIPLAFVSLIIFWLSKGAPLLK